MEDIRTGLADAHGALCRSVDALNPAWEHLSYDLRTRLQRVVNEIESIRDHVAEQLDRIPR
jgi:hypothetical protein